MPSDSHLGSVSWLQDFRAPNNYLFSHCKLWGQGAKTIASLEIHLGYIDLGMGMGLNTTIVTICWVAPTGFPCNSGQPCGPDLVEKVKSLALPVLPLLSYLLVWGPPNPSSTSVKTDPGKKLVSHSVWQPFMDCSDWHYDWFIPSDLTLKPVNQFFHSSLSEHHFLSHLLALLNPAFPPHVRDKIVIYGLLCARYCGKQFCTVVNIGAQLLKFKFWLY